MQLVNRQQMSSDHQNPGRRLGFLGDYTTQLYRDYMGS